MNPFSSHLEEVGESYACHMVKAGGFALAMLVAGIACLLHALLPFMFVRTGSNCIRRLHRLMVEERLRTVEAEPSKVA